MKKIDEKYFVNNNVKKSSCSIENILNPDERILLRLVILKYI